MLAAALLTVYGIVARALPADLPLLGSWRPLRGTFELVELATAVAIFSFLPYTQLRRGNVAVDLFTAAAPPRTKAALTVVGDLLFAAIALLVAWRMGVGAAEMATAGYARTTMLLRVPVLYAYLPGASCMAFLAVVTLFSVWRGIDEARTTGRREDRPS